MHDTSRYHPAGAAAGDCPPALLRLSPHSAGLFILRVGVAAMMLCHGLPKLLLLIRGQGSLWMDPLGLGSTLSLILCTFAEFGCSLAILVGFFTRLASLALVVNFGVIVFIYGGGSFWPQSELPLLYLICFVTLLCTGPGRLSLDHFIRHSRHSTAAGTNHY